MIELILQAERALSVGMLDQAERLYRQAADLDPRNSIAVVGLARVTLDRGDDAGALALTRRALEIDPENVAAQRLAERLEEVLRYRGEEPAPVEAGEPPPPEPATPEAPGAPEASAPPDVPAPLDVPATQPPRRRPSLLDRLRRRR